MPSEKATLKAQKNIFSLQYSQLSQEFADDDENLDQFGFALCQTFSKFEDQLDFCKKSRFLPGYKKYVNFSNFFNFVWKIISTNPQQCNADNFQRKKYRIANASGWPWSWKYYDYIGTRNPDFGSAAVMKCDKGKLNMGFLHFLPKALVQFDLNSFLLTPLLKPKSTISGIQSISTYDNFSTFYALHKFVLSL